jgi:hypothetical protein
MKLHPALSLLLLAAGWIDTARSDVRHALFCGRTGRLGWKAQYLHYARHDAANYRAYTRMWAAQSIA